MIQFGGFVFETIAYLVDMMKDYDFVIGQKFMYELEGGIDFENLQFHFNMKTLELQSKSDLMVAPGESNELSMKLQNCPRKCWNVPEAIVKLKYGFPHLPATLKVPIQNGEIHIKVENKGSKPWSISSGDSVGSIDMRSIGYFHISRDKLQMILDCCNFLNGRDSNHFIQEMLFENPQDQVCSICTTRLKEKKQPTIDDDSTDLKNTDDPYPWLDHDDPRRKMTDEQLIRKLIDLSQSYLTEEEKEELIQIIMKYRRAFSLRDEIGVCPHMEVELELTDTSPFFIRPFPIAETEKPIVEKEMRKGVLLGILKKGMSSYSSPIMLIPRKLTGIPRIVTDFRFLNSRLKILNPSIPLVRDAIQMIGASGCEILSVIDLRDAYHTLRLSERSQQFCGITPFYGSDTYLYKRLAMGLSCSPALWQNFINSVLNKIPKNLNDQNRTHHLAIMDDVCVFSKFKDHKRHLIELFEALIKAGLKISPKKCQLFRKKLIYMGHHMMIENDTPCITLLKSRLEAIEQLGPLKTPKNCKQFCGMVNYLSMYLKDLQRKLIPIYKLTKKGMPFHWGTRRTNSI